MKIQDNLTSANGLNRIQDNLKTINEKVSQGFGGTVVLLPNELSYLEVKNGKARELDAPVWSPLNQNHNWFEIERGYGSNLTSRWTGLSHRTNLENALLTGWQAMSKDHPSIHIKAAVFHSYSKENNDGIAHTLFQTSYSNTSYNSRAVPIDVTFGIPFIDKLPKSWRLSYLKSIMDHRAGYAYEIHGFGTTLISRYFEPDDLTLSILQFNRLTNGYNTFNAHHLMDDGTEIVSELDFNNVQYARVKEFKRTGSGSMEVKVKLDLCEVNPEWDQKDKGLIHNFGSLSRNKVNHRLISTGKEFDMTWASGPFYDRERDYIGVYLGFRYLNNLNGLDENDLNNKYSLASFIGFGGPETYISKGELY